MRRTTCRESAHTADTTHAPADISPANNGLPNRLITAFEVAEFIGCHEETVRRAYLRDLLVSQRFGVRGRGSIPQTSSTGFVRHEALSRLADKGVPVHELQMLAGHANITTTQRDMNARANSLAESMRQARQRRADRFAQQSDDNMQVG
jgi:hypothetical protein